MSRLVDRTVQPPGSNPDPDCQSSDHEAGRVFESFRRSKSHRMNELLAHVIAAHGGSRSFGEDARRR
jgi:hypothetical protein